MKELTINPCICNGERKVGIFFYQAWKLYYVICPNCHLQGRGKKKRNEAIKDWNERIKKWSLKEQNI